jgi:hypothetical protein
MVRWTGIDEDQTSGHTTILFGFGIYDPGYGIVRDEQYQLFIYDVKIIFSTCYIHKHGLSPGH